MQIANVSIENQLAAAWPSTATNVFQASALSASNAFVFSATRQNLGNGTVALQASSAIPAAVSGSDEYQLRGTGGLSFYSPSESTLGVSGDWQNYTATVTGDVSITLTVPAGILTLNGTLLPAGTYTITTSSAMLSGSGTTSSPTFSGSASITATDGTLKLGPGTGPSPSAASRSIRPTRRPSTATAARSPFRPTATGPIRSRSTATRGTSSSSGQPSALTTDQNTPVTFAANVSTSLADTYNFTVNAPTGWTVTIDSKGNVTATPAPGLQSGTYPIQIIAQSQTDANLEAQTTVEVTITPTQPGINFTVATDPQFTVPFNGARLPTAFRATIQNVGPAADTYDLTFSNVPSGFSIEDSGTSVTVPAGATGIFGLYLVPNAGQPVPAAGTVVSFTVTATSTTDSSITQTQTETLTVPDIDAVSLTRSPAALSSTPGVAASTTLTLQNDGNVSETVTLTPTTPTGVTAGSLAPITIAPGATQTETLTLTPASSVTLNQTLATPITASYGPSSAPLTTTDEIDLLVQSAQAAAVSQAAIAAGSANNSQLASVLTDLSNTLAMLQTGTSAALFTEAQTDLGNLKALVSADPALATFASQVQPLLTDAQSHDLTDLLANITSLFNNITVVLNQEASEQFTASLSPAEVTYYRRRADARAHVDEHGHRCRNPESVGWEPAHGRDGPARPVAGRPRGR